MSIPTLPAELAAVIDRGDAGEIDRHAEHLFDAGKIDLARSFLEQAVKLPQAQGIHWAALGYVYRESGDLDLAMTAWTRAIEAGYASWGDRGLAAEKLGFYEAARDDYHKALEYDPDDLNTLVNLGTLELQLDDVAAAYGPLQRAAKMDPQANWQLAEAFAADGRVKDAISSLWIAIRAGEHRAYLDLAEIEAQHDQGEAAVEHFWLAVEAGSTFARRELAFHLLQSGQIREAESVARSGAILGDELCFAPLAIALEELGLVEEAHDYYRLAVDSGDSEYEAKLD